MKIVRSRLRFSGTVQGVGFRYRMYYAAQSLGLTGWVKNCPDGTVLSEVQGSSADIDKLLSAVSNGSYIDITDISSEKLPPDENERSFVIRG